MLKNKENTNPLIKSKKPKKVLLNVIELFTKNVITETQNAVLYKLDDESQIWIPFTKCWINKIKNDTFKIAYYENDDYKFHVTTKECKENEYMEFTFENIVDSVKENKEHYAEYAILVK